MRRWWTWGLTILWVLGIAAFQLWKYTHFRYNGLDLGIYTQTIWSLAHGHGFASSIHDPSYIGDHLEPILVPISWVYRVTQTPLTILFIQTLALGSGLWLLLRYVFAKFPLRWAIPAAIAVTINPLLFNAALYEFHALTLLFPVLVWSWIAYERHRWWQWAFAVLLTAVWREDMPILILGWSVLALVERRNWRWWLPPIVIAPIWFLLAEHIIQLHALAGYKYLAFYQRLGTTWAQLALSPFRHPIIFLSQLLHPYNIMTTLGFAASVGGLCLLRPRRLLLVSVLALQLFLTAPMPTSVLRLHYIIPYLPFLFWASFEALEELRHGSAKWWGHGLARDVTALFSGVTVLYMLAVVGPFVWPWKNQDGDAAPTSVVRAALATIHPSDSVLASFAVLPNLGDRANLYSLSYEFLGTRQYSQIPYQLPHPPDVIILDQQQWYEYPFFYRETTVDGKTGYDRFNALLSDGHYAPIFQRDSWIIYRRNSAATTSPVVATTEIDKTFDPLTVARATAIYSNAAVTVSMNLSAHAIVDVPIDVLVRIKQGKRVVREQRRIILRDATPAMNLAVGTTWNFTTSFDLQKKLPGSATVSVTFERVDGEYRLDRLLSFHPVVNSETILGSITLPIVAGTTPS